MIESDSEAINERAASTAGLGSAACALVVLMNTEVHAQGNRKQGN